MIDLYKIDRDINPGVIIGFGRCIVIRVGSDICGEVEGGDYGDILLEVVGEFGVRDVRSVGKYANGGFDGIIDENVGWGDDRGDYDGVVRCVDVNVRI